MPEQAVASPNAAPETRRARLLDILRERAVSFGDFTLASGRKSGYYIDARVVTLHHEGAYLIARAILDFLSAGGIEADAVGGMAIGADPIAGAVAALSHREAVPLSGFIVRKESKGHGTGRRIEGGLASGSRVVVVDDVITTGGSTLAAIRAVEEIGCKVAAVICVIDREEGGAQTLKEYRFHPLFRVSELIDRGAARA
jgi:orotate phosphoribosyltransferase